MTVLVSCTRVNCQTRVSNSLRFVLRFFFEETQ
jgi:hypothetical protein